MLHARAQTHDIRLGATAPVSNAQVFDRFADQLNESATTAGGPAGDFQVRPDNEWRLDGATYHFLCMPPS